MLNAAVAAAPQVAEAEGWTVSQTIDALIRKAGCDAFPTPALRDSLQITLYQVRPPWPLELPVCWTSPLVKQHVLPPACEHTVLHTPRTVIGQAA